MLPHQSVDLLIIDPPYNLTKSFGDTKFTKRSTASYEDWVLSWLVLLVPLLKPTASIYVCSDWRSSGIMQRILVLDPFLGSGTTSVVAKKLDRQFIGIEKEETYCLLAEKRLEMADRGSNVQGYSGGYFWERNTLVFQQSSNTRSNSASHGQTPLFEHES